MSWDTLSWQPVTPETLDGAGALVHLAPLLRSAVEEAASALVMGPVSVTDLTFAAASGGELDGDLLPATSIELLGTPRRTVWASIEPAAPVLNGSPIGLDSLAAALIEAFDAAFAELLGEGLSMAVATDLPDAAASLTVFRVALRDDAGTTVTIIAAVEANVPAELAMHVVALQALGTASSGAGANAGANARGETGLPASPASSVTVNDLAARAEAAASSGSAASTPAGPETVTPRAGALPGAVVAPQAPAAQAGPAIRPFQLDELPPVPVVPTSQNIDLLMGVSLQVTVEIGRTKLAIRDVLALTPGSIVELDKLAGEKVDVLVNGQQIAQGEVVVVDENFGVRITDVVSRQRRILSADTAA